MKQKIIENLIIFWGLALIAIPAWEFNIPPNADSSFLSWLLFAILLMITGPYFKGKFDDHLGWIFANKEYVRHFAHVGLVVPFFVVVYIALQIFG
jgi:hypothetical protein